MKRTMVFGVVICVCLVLPAYGQQIDVAFGGGSTAAPGSLNLDGPTAFAQSLSGGAYVGFSGDVLIRRSLGVEGEVAWRGSQGLYGGQVPYRPLFWDINGVYAPRFNKYLGAEVLAGIGGESIRFYSGTFNCDFYGNCSNYVSSNHFMGDFGGGIRLYTWRSLFVRPEVRLYLVHNNVEFSSSHAVRYGVSIGYTFGGSK